MRFKIYGFPAIIDNYDYLSILFMRFNFRPSSLWWWLWCCFQFSLWDSWFILLKWMQLVRLTFNSLYEILPVTRLSKRVPFKVSFNSLYEIHIFKEGLKDTYAVFQFSLWDSWKSRMRFCKLANNFQFSLWDSNFNTCNYSSL